MKKKGKAKRERIYVENTMLTNTPAGRRHPAGLRWELYVVYRIGREGSNSMATFEGATKKEAVRALRAFVERPHVTIVDELPHGKPVAA